MIEEDILTQIVNEQFMSTQLSMLKASNNFSQIITLKLEKSFITSTEIQRLYRNIHTVIHCQHSQNNVTIYTRLAYEEKKEKQTITTHLA